MKKIPLLIFLFGISFSGGAPLHAAADKPHVVLIAGTLVEVLTATIVLVIRDIGKQRITFGDQHTGLVAIRQHHPILQ